MNTKFLAGCGSPPMFAFQPDWSDALDACVADMLAAAAVAAPPVDAVEVAAALNFVIALDDRQDCRARRVRLPTFAGGSGSTILLRPEPRHERIQWAVAHEIGEHFACDVFERLGLGNETPTPGDRERTANGLANRLLLPSAWFFCDGRASDWDLTALKTQYATASYELLARRMLDDHTAPAVVTIFDHGRIVLRRSASNGGTPRLTVIEREAREAAYASGNPVERRNTECRVRAWPIHEPDWKREILRTEAADAWIGE